MYESITCIEHIKKTQEKDEDIYKYSFLKTYMITNIYIFFEVVEF